MNFEKIAFSQFLSHLEQSYNFSYDKLVREGASTDINTQEEKNYFDIPKSTYYNWRSGKTLPQDDSQIAILNQAINNHITEYNWKNNEDKPNVDLHYVLDVLKNKKYNNLYDPDFELSCDITDLHFYPFWLTLNRYHYNPTCALLLFHMGYGLELYQYIGNDSSLLESNNKHTRCTAFNFLCYSWEFCSLAQSVPKYVQYGNLKNTPYSIPYMPEIDDIEAEKLYNIFQEKQVEILLKVTSNDNSTRYMTQSEFNLFWKQICKDLYHNIKMHFSM